MVTERRQGVDAPVARGFGAGERSTQLMPRASVPLVNCALFWGCAVVPPSHIDFSTQAGQGGHGNRHRGGGLLPGEVGQLCQDIGSLPVRQNERAVCVNNVVYGNEIM